jgi:large-conductance mechanosensitive channel
MVYDFENKEIGFYNKENVHFIGKYKPLPPRKYNFVKDDEDLKPQKAENKSVNILPEAEGENGSEFDKTIEVEKTSDFNLSEFLQSLLSFLIILMVFAIVIFVFYSYNRYKKIKKFNKNIEYYQKQTDNISSENLI